MASQNESAARLEDSSSLSENCTSIPLIPTGFIAGNILGKIMVGIIGYLVCGAI
jgi:hypothetical protein